MNTTNKNKKYDRETYEGYVHQYLETLSNNDPSTLPLAKNVRFVENNQKLRLGDGTWKTITGLGNYRNIFVDELKGQTVAICVVEENKKKIIFVLRLKIVEEKITEIETIPVRDPIGAERYEEWEGDIVDLMPLVSINIPPKPKRTGSNGIYEPPRNILKKIPGLKFGRFHSQCR